MVFALEGQKLIAGGNATGNYAIRPDPERVVLITVKVRPFQGRNLMTTRSGDVVPGY